jgi:hypothetical protein
VKAGFIIYLLTTHLWVVSTQVDQKKKQVN